MEDAKLVHFLLSLTAGLARDLEAAGLLSDASRKAIHSGLSKVRGSAEDEVAGPDQPSDESAIAFRILDGIAPAADG